MEIGHGDGTPGGSSGTSGGESGGEGASAGSSSGGTDGNSGAAGSLTPVGGDGSGATGAVGGGIGTTGPIPPDDGPQAEVGKVDLLLAIDNSISMAEKQKLFAKALPELVKRLINPRCVSTTGAVVEEPASPSDPCPAGSNREFDALRDLHVGVISSSLGAHGAPGTKDVCVRAQDDDHAHLIPTVRTGVPSYNDTGYLNWDPDGTSSPAGEADPQAFADALGTMIGAVGETGCGYEAQLESVYRFLVDPAPPASITVQSTIAEPQGVDTALLAQRASFLRPDSSVVVLMLTDENDCSIVDEGYGWLVARSESLYRATSACATSPNDPCCQSCAEQAPNAGCPALTQDSECVKGTTLSRPDDDLNLRCWEQKRRFGFSLLYPTQRYVGGFSGASVRSRDGSLVPNPLFRSGGKVRDPSLFTLAVIGGVPWQDLATSASLKGNTLEYMTNAQLTAANRWPVLIGNPDAFERATDPFMHEQPDPRSGKNPITGDAIVSESSTDPRANAINGHEQVNVASSDLQYACTFELPEPVTCDEATYTAGRGCDCFAEDAPFGRSVCQPPAGGAASTTQYYGKAYPALRELDVARQLGRRSVLGSICSRNTRDDTRSDYGYRPVFNAIGRRVAETLSKP